MADADAWMPVYLGDYLGDTTRLTTEQHGAYLLLLFDYWRNGPPPADDAVLAQVTRLSRAQWKKHKLTILKFFEERDGTLFHNRVEKELRRAADNQERRTEKARKAAQARWTDDATGNAPSNAPSKPRAKHGECPPPSPRTLSGSSRAKPKIPLPDDWEPQPFKAGKCKQIVDSWSTDRFETEVAKFKAHHRRAGSLWASWQDTWETWVLNSRDFEPRFPAKPEESPSYFDHIRQQRAAAGAVR